MQENASWTARFMFTADMKVKYPHSYAVRRVVHRMVFCKDAWWQIYPPQEQVISKVKIHLSDMNGSVEASSDSPILLEGTIVGFVGYGTSADKKQIIVVLHPLKDASFYTIGRTDETAVYFQEQFLSHQQEIYENGLPQVVLIDAEALLATCT